MLTLLRELVRSKVAVVLIALLIVSLAVWGITDIFRAGPRDSLVTAGSRTLTLTDFEGSVDNYLDNVRRQTGTVTTRRELAESGQLDEIFASELNRTIQLGYASRLGAIASNQALADNARTIEAFRNPATGEFDTRTYLDTLQRNGIPAALYERDVRDGLSIAYLREGLTSAITVPDALARVQQDFLTETREVSWLVFPASMMPRPAAVTADEIEAFYNENLAAFEVPERRALAVLSFSATDFIEAADVRNEDILAVYEAEKARRFTVPGPVTLTQLTYASREAASEALARLNVGETLDSLPAALQPAARDTRMATKDSLDTRIATDLYGPFSREGAVFGPYPAGDAFQILRVDTQAPGLVQPLEAVREQIQGELAARAAQKLYYEAIETVDRDLSAGESLPAIAGQIGVPLITYLPVTDRGMTENRLVLAGVARFPEALAQAQLLQPGEITDPFDGPGDSTVLMGVDAILPPFVPPLDTVREDIGAALARRKAAEAASDFANGLKARLDSGESTLADEAKAFGGVIVSPVGGIDRRNVPQDLDRSLVNAVYSAAAGEVIVMPNGQGGVTAVIVTAVTLPGEGDGQALADIRAALAEPVRGDLVTATLVDISTRMNVKIDQGAFSAYRAEALGQP